MLITLVILLVLIITVFVYLQQPAFGKMPAGKDLERIRQSPNFREGKFQNLRPTPDLTEGASILGVLHEFLFNRNQLRPLQALRTEKTDLRALPPQSDVLVWFGHSSYFLQIDGKKILVDPVLSGAASPIRFTNPSFPGSDVYTTEDLPDIDYLFLSHDHWDHLDYATIKKMQARIGQVITGLGTGAHLERWGFSREKILEKDWNEHVELSPGFTVEVLPARHFSGRGFKRGQALWVSFALKTPTLHLYLGGDSGYDTHFADIGRRHGPFDLAILECGQYDKSWKYIHMMPEEVVQAALDLGAVRLLPVHWGKFVLANHAWNEPLLRATAAAQKAGLPIITPLIGEAVDLKSTAAIPSRWTGMQ